MRYSRTRQDKPNVWIRAKLVGTPTEKAVKIQPANQSVLFWLPKSQIVNLDDVFAYLTESGDDNLYVDWEVKEWIATKNGIPTVEETGEEEQDLDLDSAF